MTVAIHSLGLNFNQKQNLLGTSETIQTQIVGEKSPADFVHG
jgi:hypothetical protein